MLRTRLLRAHATLGCAGALALLLNACYVGPTYHRPDIPAPDRWKQSSGDEPASAADESAAKTSSASQAPSAANAQGVWPATDWWQSFGSSQLNEYIAEAQKNNDDLRSAAARVEQADAQARIAGAALLPSLALDVNADRARAPITGEGPKTLNGFGTLLSASYQLDFWGKNRAARQAALAAARSSRFDQQTVALTVVSSVASSYFQALELRDRIAVARENAANGEKILQGIRLQRDAGIATGLDVAQQETTVSLLHAAIPPLVQQLRQTVFALGVLLGRTPESIDVDAGTLADLKLPPIIEGLPSQLLSRRPDVASAEQQLIEANANIGVARAALFPSITLTADGGYESSQLSGLFTRPNAVWSVSAGLVQPIFEGGALRAGVSLDKARYQELLGSYHKSVLSAFSNVESALTANQQVAEQERRQRDAVDKARRAYQFAQKQMSAGTVNILNVLNTENALFSAQDELVQVQYLRLQAMVSLFTALGGGWTQS